MTIEITKALVKNILVNSDRYEWTLQGFGMLRCYLPNDVRLHVWDDRYQVPDVSLIHDHPWDFESLIVVGHINNHRYTLHEKHGHPFNEQTVRPGIGMESFGIKRVQLVMQPDEHYQAGDSYTQTANEIHATQYSRGTITLVKRQRKGEDVARIYWPEGKEFVSAEPREAKWHERNDIIGNCLTTRFN